MRTKLVRVSEKHFEKLCDVAGKLQAREHRRVSLDEALGFVLFRESEEKTTKKTTEKRGGVHTKLNLKAGGSAPKKRGKTLKKSEAHLVHEPLKRFSLRHKKFVAE